MRLLDMLKFGRPRDASPTAPQRQADGFPLPVDGPLAASHAEVEAYVYEAAGIGRHYPPVEPKETESGRRILALAPEAQVRVAVAAMERAAWAARHRDAKPGVPWWVKNLASDLLRALLRRRLPFSPAELAAMLEPCGQVSYVIYLPLKSLLTQAGHLCGDAEARRILEPALRSLAARLPLEFNAENRELARRIAELLAGGETLALEPEPWTADVDAMGRGGARALGGAPPPSPRRHDSQGLVAMAEGSATAGRRGGRTRRPRARARLARRGARGG